MHQSRPRLAVLALDHSVTTATGGAVYQSSRRSRGVYKNYNASYF